LGSPEVISSWKKPPASHELADAQETACEAVGVRFVAPQE
jgi:hypothetical protein